MESFKKIEDNSSFNPEELSAYNEYWETVIKESDEQYRKDMELMYSHLL